MDDQLLRVGTTCTLTIQRFTKFGAYLGRDDSRDVLLPKKQVPHGASAGDRVEVFLYRDSEDRLIATTRIPAFGVGSLACLEVKNVSRIGAFLSWGLEKDLFLPYQEMEGAEVSGQTVPVYIYADKSDRLCASMKKVYDHLERAPRGLFSKDDPFEGVVYKTSRQYGVFAAVIRGSDWYFGLIPVSQVFRKYRPGDRVRGRIVRVREDGKLDLSVRQKAYRQMGDDAETILEKIREYDGVLPFSDNAPPEIIRRELNMSKNGFKKALGHLYKEGQVIIGENEVRLTGDTH
ncbi:MAG: RNA-binding protein [Clostridia bacterium]|nr:RNA-binding protein [Clostridia bacterium]